MYLKQPDTYYIEIAAILCSVFTIPDSEKLALIGIKCKREIEIKKTSYKVHGKVRHYCTPVNKYQDAINAAKDLLYLYLWNKKIKPPTGNHRRMMLSSINEYKQTIETDKNLQIKNELFILHANRIATKTLVKKVVVEETFI